MTPNDPHLYRKLLAEFLGTAYLVMTVCLARGYNIAVPAIIVSVTGSTGLVSGAFYNPAVALGVLIKSQLQKGVCWATVKLYGVIMLIEVLAALCGAYYAFLISGDTFKLTKNPECSPAEAFLAEVMGAAQLVAMALMVPEHHPHILVGVFCVAGSVLATIQWDTSGAVMNPALGIGIKLIDAANYGSERLESLWIYMTAPFVGAVVGTICNSIYIVEVRRRRAERLKSADTRSVIQMQKVDEHLLAKYKRSNDSIMGTANPSLTINS